MATNRPIEILAAALLSYILFASFSIVPVVGVLLAVLAPIPLIISYNKAGKVPCLLAFILAAVILLLTTDIQTVVFFAVIVGLMAAIIGEGLHREISMAGVVVWSTLAVLVLLAAVAGGAAMTQGINPMAFLHQYVTANLEETVKVYRELKMNADDIDMLAANIPMIAETFVRLFPSFAMVSIGGAAFISYVIAAMVLSRIGVIHRPTKPFPLWIVPDHIIWGVIGGGGLLLIPLAAAKSIGGNILIPLLSIYLVQGISVVAFFFAKWQFHPLLRALGYFLITTQVFFLFPVLSLGVFDTWADFRKLRKPAVPKNDDELT
ncbi:MAG: YybS family protein [Nitrospirota bacterium]|nr:YybS family protein [Nitrospirota bacterium]